ncbi:MULTISPECIES: hypothetical protein [Streptomyces]|uniref:Uncharacterized protein n=1 Tax=Streptomyces fradiae ATCC 10745 = DSM 40063 TaxID=1319510 RepID=A0A1Y2NRD3_STRFR|nr:MULTISPECIES: hypothetical protein [Streptomyces]KAF0646870.1 hypothetical protein K701_26595 [Streptomyces fradiae ATCC 10745 = DSM 40063]OSY49639.1 hypothetical protein BG846_04779 [Streptomyces fradiae ATCC 10745 = DSM 40063]OSY51112.1 hypothetical protein BG846_03210 [Streptomyces fradiae ATCC 10745 = DSM 40063]OSY51182.1 hypothetical protein BG846_03164 [Streptomyces fradiae ATCC 10745 = DSM 40063]QEV10692.1 hypothetical protein CP974_00140 [Streptomyces fradiae ATCC 10745 = DSM 40063]
MTAPTLPPAPAPRAAPPAAWAARPVRLLLDGDDDHNVHRAAYQWADPAQGRITVDPTPHTTSPAYLALDVLRASGRDGFLRPEAERMSTDPAWRAVTCWTLACGLDEVIVLRAHRLTTERLRRLAVWRADTGIRLTLLAHTPEQTDLQRLLEHLTAAELVDVATVRGTAAVLEAIGPAATRRRTGPPPRDHAHPLPALPRSSVAAFRADCWRRQNATDFAHTDGQYRAGYAAARTWLARTLPPPPAPVGGITSADDPAEPTLFTLQETEAVRLFLARLTVSSPSAAHTVARVRGAQAGFLSRSSLLNVPDDLASCAGPGLTTVPLTPRTVHTITVRLPNPLRAAAIAALLFTGTDKSLLSMTQIGSVDDTHTIVAIDRDSRINIGEPPGPRHLYAVPPRARPLLHAAVAFRRHTPRTADNHGLFANCFGTTPRFEALIADAGLPIPALLHPHPGDDWHTAARCWHLHTPTPSAPDVLPRLGELHP